MSSPTRCRRPANHMATGKPRGNGRDGGRKISKGGIRLMMESPGQELATSRARVNAIAPGAIRTPINAAAWQTDEAYDQLMKLVPYGRIGKPEDTRAAV